MSLRFKSEAEIPAHLLRRPTVARFELPEPKRRKYGNEPIVADGHRFDSKFEYKRYTELKNLEACGEITELRVHVSFGLHIKNQRLGAIEVDFVYRRGGVAVLEDTKSEFTKTPIYLWKKDHLRIEYGLEIIEIERNKRRAA